MIRRVFDGGDGLIKGGMDERSRESGVRVPFDAGLEDCEIGGEERSSAMTVAEFIVESRKVFLSLSLLR